jgi:hypothetical protein
MMGAFDVLEIQEDNIDKQRFCVCRLNSFIAGWA